MSNVVVVCPTCRRVNCGCTGAALASPVGVVYTYTGVTLPVPPPSHPTCGSGDWFYDYAKVKGLAVDGWPRPLDWKPVRWCRGFGERPYDCDDGGGHA
jgi:hypothetical protein